ncbi:MAG: Arginine--tRNA ligase [Chloroflexi bacterium ADurb.Bin180]|nr:MAG: Arginine--tRNA ligase [Chloroflexi bacterium ADurb.Bin180]
MIRDDIAKLLHKAIRKAQKKEALREFEIPTIPVERPKQEGRGDLASPICLQMASLARMAPMRIAEIVIPLISKTDYLSKAEFAPPGYINLYLDPQWVAQQVRVILDAGERFGDVPLGDHKRVQVEYISANPTGPLHIGSGRNAVIGDALANVLEAGGYEVQREYYVNDAGTQMGLFAETLYARYAQALGSNEAVPEGGYLGAYMVELGRRAVEEHGDRLLSLSKADALKELNDIGLAYMLDSIGRDAELLGIHYDRYFSERSLYQDGTFGRVMSILREGGHVVEKDGAVWFSAGTGGKEKDEVIIRSNGTPGYFASDIAYHYDKFVRRGFDRVIDVWGADHQGHVPRMYAMMKALGLDPQRLSIILYQLVTLKRSGEVVRLSKRTGDIVTLREVLEDVGADAVRFFLLSRAAESQMDFDLDLAKEQSNENPVYYIQYAHARICSIVRVAQERDQLGKHGNLALLTHPMEQALIQSMIMLPEIVKLAAETLAPHHLAAYAQELAGHFHAFYRDCRVVSSDAADEELTQARLELVQAARIVLARVLKLMGMSTPEQM